jgi:hypothetical protein
MFYSSAKRQEYWPSTRFARFHQPLLSTFCAAIQHTTTQHDRSFAVAPIAIAVAVAPVATVPHCYCSCSCCPIAIAPLQTIAAVSVAPFRRFALSAMTTL